MHIPAQFLLCSILALFFAVALKLVLQDVDTGLRGSFVLLSILPIYLELSESTYVGPREDAGFSVLVSMAEPQRTRSWL